MCWWETLLSAGHTACGCCSLAMSHHSICIFAKHGHLWRYKGKHSKNKKSRGLECELRRGIQCVFKIRGERQPRASSIKHIMARYLAHDSHIAESSYQPMGGLSHQRHFGSRIIHPWCDCWWISIIMVLLTQGSVVSISCWAQTVTGEARLLSHCSQTCGWAAVCLLFHILSSF